MCLDWFTERAIFGPFGNEKSDFCPQASVQALDNPETISGDPVLAGFALDL